MQSDMLPYNYYVIRSFVIYDVIYRDMIRMYMLYVICYNGPLDNTILAIIAATTVAVIAASADSDVENAA